jgi:hypothetical protein
MLKAYMKLIESGKTKEYRNLKERAIVNISKASKKTKAKLDSKIQDRIHYSEGDSVLLSTKKLVVNRPSTLHPRFIGTYIIKQVYDN